MRSLFWALALASLVLVGCSGHRGGAPSFSEIPARGGGARSDNRVIMTPDTQLIGKVVKVNLQGQFVILSFPIGHLPSMQQTLSVYRRGLKVGELRATGPQLDDNVVADISAGDAQVGDEVRSR